MLTAHRERSLRRRWEIAQDGTHRTTLGFAGMRGHARFELDGRVIDIAPNLRGSRWTATEDGRVVVEVEHPARKNWTVTYGGYVVTARRTSWWRGEHHLQAGDRPVGTVRRLSRRKPDACAELPGLPEPVAVIVLAVRVLVAQRQAAGAAAASAASG